MFPLWDRKLIPLRIRSTDVASAEFFEKHLVRGWVGGEMLEIFYTRSRGSHWERQIIFCYIFVRPTTWIIVFSIFFNFVTGGTPVQFFLICVFLLPLSNEGSTRSPLFFVREIFSIEVRKTFEKKIEFFEVEVKYENPTHSL